MLFRSDQVELFVRLVRFRKEGSGGTFKGCCYPRVTKTIRSKEDGNARCRDRTLAHWNGCCCGDPSCLQPSAVVSPLALLAAPIVVPTPMPSALRTMAPGSSIYADGPLDLRLSEHRTTRRGPHQVGLRAFSDGLPLTSIHLRALQASIVRRWGVGFADFPAVGETSCWLAPPLALDYQHRLPHGLAEFEVLRS